MPLTAPHKPVLPHARFKGHTKLGPYGDFIVQCDAIVGRVLESLDAFNFEGQHDGRLLERQWVVHATTQRFQCRGSCR